MSNTDDTLKRMRQEAMYGPQSKQMSLDEKLREILTTLVQNTWDASGEGYNGEYTSLSHPGGKRYSEEEVLADVMKHLEDYHGDALPIAQIKAAFADETGLTKLMQDMANLQANMKQDMLRLGLTPTPEKHESEDYNRMTGQVWYDRFEKEIRNPSYMTIHGIYGEAPESVEVYKPGKVLEIARKASNLDA